MVALNFSQQFASKVASREKRQTIRQTFRGRAGCLLQLYTGQRTKACRKLVEPDPVCIGSTYVGLTAKGVTLGDASRFPGNMDDFARQDGFENYAAMWKWFSGRYKTNSFTGRVIRWEWPTVAETAGAPQIHEPLHIVPYGSSRWCCSCCGRMCWPGMAGSAQRWVDDWVVWEADPQKCSISSTFDFSVGDTSVIKCKFSNSIRPCR